MFYCINNTIAKLSYSKRLAAAHSVITAVDCYMKLNYTH